jgi:preprotein translocase subunit SecG
MFWTDIIIDVLLVIYVLDCIFMGLVIMMQRSKQEGLGAAFGGGFTESIWGAQTSNVLVKATVYAAILFFVLSISLARLYTYRESVTSQLNAAPSDIMKQLTTPVPAAASAANATNAAVTPAIPAPATTATAPSSIPATTPAPVPPASATTATKPTPSGSK